MNKKDLKDFQYKVLEGGEYVIANKWHLDNSISVSLILTNDEPATFYWLGDASYQGSEDRWAGTLINFYSISIDDLSQLQKLVKKIPKGEEKGRKWIEDNIPKANKKWLPHI